MTQANSSGLTCCLFLEVNTLFFDVSVVSFPSFRCRLFKGFRWRWIGNANIEFTGFILVQPGTPSKWTEHIPVCLITFKLSIRQAAPVVTFPQHNTYLRCPEGMDLNLTFARCRYFLTFFCFWVLFLQLKVKATALADSFLPRISLTLVGFTKLAPVRPGIPNWSFVNKPWQRFFSLSLILW